MHELAVTESLVNIAIETAKHHQALRVTKMRLVRGELSTYVPDCIQEYFNMMTEDTPAQGCVLEFRTIEAKCSCTKCGNQFRPEHMSFACPSCGSYKTEIIEGKDLTVEDLEIET